jgi:predicted transcriptional regulator
VATKFTLASGTEVTVASGNSAFNSDITLTAGTFESNIIAYTNNAVGRSSAAQLCFVQQGYLPSGSKIEITFNDKEEIDSFAASQVTLTKGTYGHNMPGAVSTMTADGGTLAQNDGSTTFTGGNLLTITTNADLGESAGLQVAFTFRTFKLTAVNVATKTTLATSGEITIASGTSAYNSDITLTTVISANIIAYTNNAVGRSSAAELCFSQLGKMPAGSKIEISFTDSEEIDGFAANQVTLTKGTYTHNMPTTPSAMNANGGAITIANTAPTFVDPLLTITTDADLAEAEGLQVAFTYRTFKLTDVNVATKYTLNTGEITIASGTAAYNTDITLTTVISANVISYTRRSSSLP